MGGVERAENVLESDGASFPPFSFFYHPTVVHFSGVTLSQVSLSLRLCTHATHLLMQPMKLVFLWSTPSHSTPHTLLLCKGKLVHEVAASVNTLELCHYVIIIIIEKNIWLKGDGALGIHIDRRYFLSAIENCSS